MKHFETIAWRHAELWPSFRTLWRVTQQPRLLCTPSACFHAIQLQSRRNDTSSKLISRTPYMFYHRGVVISMPNRDGHGSSSRLSSNLSQDANLTGLWRGSDGLAQGRPASIPLESLPFVRGRRPGCVYPICSQSVNPKALYIWPRDSLHTLYCIPRGSKRHSSQTSYLDRTVMGPAALSPQRGKLEPQSACKGPNSNIIHPPWPDLAG